MKSIHAIYSLAALALIAGAARSQGKQFSFAGDAVAGVGDVDGDGFDDFAAGSDGALRVYSGVTGGLVLTIPAPAAGDVFGFDTSSPGDANGDGRADVVTAGIGAGAYLVLASGADGSILWQLPEPVFAAGIDYVLVDDLDGDGIRDLATISGDGTSAPIHVVSLVSGRTGSTLRVLTAATGRGGVLEPTGDWNGDGQGDLLIGDPSFNANEGRVSVHDLLGGSLLATLDAPTPAGRFGSAMASVGDVDGDGSQDVFVSSLSEIHDDGYGRGRVRLISGASGSEVLELDVHINGSGPLIHYGNQLVAIGDQDGDGIRDVMVAAGAYRVGCCGSYSAEIRAHSSIDGSPMFMLPGSGNYQFESLPDANGDGREDLIVSHYGTGWIGENGTFPEFGGVVLSGWFSPLPWIPWVGGCPPELTSEGCTPRMDYRGAPSPTIGEELVVQAEGLPAGTFGIFVMNFRWWGTTPLGGRTLCMGGPLQRLETVRATSDGAPCSGSAQPTGSVTRVLPKTELASLGLAPGDAFGIGLVFRDSGFAPPGNLGMTNPVVFQMWP